MIHMNQESNNLNQNHFNVQGNNEIPNLNSEPITTPMDNAGNSHATTSISSGNEFNTPSMINNVSQSQTMIQPQQVNNSNVQSNNVQQSSNSSANENLHSNTNQSNLSIQQTTNDQNVFVNQQPVDHNINDEELLKSFVGNNYEKIATRTFNFAGFFFTTFYMFYRKMFLYGILLFLVNLVVLNLINNVVITLLFNVAVGILVNKVYLFYAKRKIEKIKAENSEKDLNEMKKICVTQGGTSIGKIFLGFLAELGITFVVLFVMVTVGIGGFVVDMLHLDNWSITINGNETDTNHSDTNKNRTLIEDVAVVGHTCYESKCNVSIEKSNNITDYTLSVKNSELFTNLDGYSEYVKVNIYYTQDGNEKTIVDYKIYVRSTNEDISSISTETELRDKIGLYSIGTHTDSLILKGIGTPGFGFKDDESYTYVDYTFVDNKNNEYEMQYINPDNSLNLIEGNTYTVTFEVVEGTLDYEFNIKSIQ